MKFAVIVQYNQLVAVDVAMWEHKLLEGLDNRLSVNFGVLKMIFSNSVPSSIFGSILITNFARVPVD